MTEKELLLELLYMAFVDIRAASYSQDSHTCFILADVFHNVPLQIHRAEKNEMSYTDIMTELRKKCEERKCVSWLKNATVHIMKPPE